MRAGGPATASERGVLGGVGVDFRVDRFPASPAVSGLVERHWTVGWDLPAGRESAATLRPHPCVNLVFVGPALAVAGVGRERFTYPLRGAGRVFGVKFRPGGFQPFLDGPVSAITGLTVPAERVFGRAATALARELGAAGPTEVLVERTEAFLLARWPEPDPNVALVGRIVAALLHDRELTRVDEVPDRFGLSVRTVQRLFQRYVGVSPKWVLRRYRLHEAAARLAEPDAAPWAEVAVELGYFDQSHFIRDFAAAVGLTPAAYAQSCRREAVPISA